VSSETIEVRVVMEDRRAVVFGDRRGEVVEWGQVQGRSLMGSDKERTIMALM
jgi:hypothetical protein